LARSRREYTDWDVWNAVGFILLGILDLLLIEIGISYNLLLYQILFYVLTILITVLVYIFFAGRFSFVKKSKEHDITAKKAIYNFLKSNINKAYTPEILLNKINVNIKNRTYKRYLRRNYEKILSEMHSDQIIEVTQKNEQNFYIFPSM